MKYRKFGSSGLLISLISMGTAINSKPQNYEEDKKLIGVCLQNGVNYFDTAQIYGAGQSEEQLGKILKELNVCRSDIVVGTKVLTGVNPDINSKMTTNRKHIKEAITLSLKRLQFDYVDIIYAHICDQNTPMQEICRGFNQVIEEGLAFYWATSNWSTAQVFQALAICENLNLHKPIGGQNQYNMLTRDIEAQYKVLFEKYGYGLIAWSPLAGGILTGRYLQGFPEDTLTRFTDNTNPKFPASLVRDLYYHPIVNEKTTRALKQLRDIANEVGCKMVHLAILWTINYPYLNSAIIGARYVAHIEETLAALSFQDKWTPQLQRKINTILENTPAVKQNWIEMKPQKPTRPVE